MKLAEKIKENVEKTRTEKYKQQRKEVLDFLEKELTSNPRTWVCIDWMKAYPGMEEELKEEGFKVITRRYFDIWGDKLYCLVSLP